MVCPGRMCTNSIHCLSGLFRRRKRLRELSEAFRRLRSCYRPKHFFVILDNLHNTTIILVSSPCNSSGQERMETRRHIQLAWDSPESVRFRAESPKFLTERRNSHGWSQGYIRESLWETRLVGCSSLPGRCHGTGSYPWQSARSGQDVVLW